MAQTIVLGLGNILLRDEGLGVRACEVLSRRYQLPSNVEVLDGGTLGLALLPHIESATDLLLIDAIHGQRPPGTLIRLEGDEIPAALAVKMSMHQVGLQELLAVGMLRDSLPQRIVLWGMQPAELLPGLELTPAVAANLDALVAAVVTELQAWGLELIGHEHA